MSRTNLLLRGSFLVGFFLVMGFFASYTLMTVTGRNMHHAGTLHEVSLGLVDSNTLHLRKRQQSFGGGQDQGSVEKAQVPTQLKSELQTDAGPKWNIRTTQVAETKWNIRSTQGEWTENLDFAQEGKDSVDSDSNPSITGFGSPVTRVRRSTHPISSTINLQKSTKFPFSSTANLPHGSTLSPSALKSTMKQSLTLSTGKAITTTTSNGAAPKPSSNTQKTTTNGFHLDNSSSNITSTTSLPSSTTVAKPCFLHDYSLNQTCILKENHIKILSENATLEDIGDQIFHNDIVDRIAKGCQSGVWCLGLDGDFKMEEDNMDYLEFCDLRSCLLQISDDCFNEHRRMILAALMLLCEVKDQNMTVPSCMTPVKKMLHVTMADMHRPDISPILCGPEEQHNCTGMCKNYGQELNCMTQMCDNKVEIFTQFSAWQWFYDLKNVTFLCGENGEMCARLAHTQKDVFTKYKKLLVELKHMDIKVLIAIVASMLGTIFAITALMCTCTKKIQKDINYNREKVGYVEVVDEESDS